MTGRVSRRVVAAPAVRTLRGRYPWLVMDGMMRSMLAELYGKLDPDSGVPADRSEDLLTEAVFGSLRYLPYTVALAEILRSVGANVTRSGLSHAQVLLWQGVPIGPAWPGKVIEPDVIVITGTTMVVFEAKLFSPFGSYHHPAQPDAVPYHQLAVQYAATKAWAAGLQLREPIMVAVTADSARPSASLNQAEHDIERLTGKAPPEGVRWLPWHKIAGILTGLLNRLRPNEQAQVHDLLQLMDRRGVRKVFTGFQMEDYWLITAAQRVASGRLYPQIRTFFDELTVALAADGIDWSQPSYKGMWLGGASTSVSKPSDWTRSYVGAPYWPEAWPKRGTAKSAANLALYAIFDFLNPAVEVGLSIPGPGVAAAQQQWAPHLNDLARELSALDRYELVLDTGDFARSARSIAAADVTKEWLASACAAMVGAAHLRLRRRLDVETVAVQQVREALAGIQNACRAVPALWAALAKTSQIAGALSEAAPETSAEAVQHSNTATL